jgi:hypothetical protein
VYRGVHPALGRDVVIKVGHEAAGEAASALVAEGRILAELDHPGLARVYDLRLHEGKPCLVMEYVRGSDLDQRARRRPFAPAEAAALVARLARALAAAHGRGVIHRDIKPRNILIDEAGQPRLIDFGLALLEDAWRRPTEAPGGLSGTVSYMAPEQARGEGATARSDLFGLGGVLFFLLTGRAPYAGQDFYAVLSQAAMGEWDRAALAAAPVPARLKAVAERALAVDPAERFASAEEMAAALESFARPGRRRRWLAAAGVIALLAIGGVVLWATWKPTPPQPTTVSPVARPFKLTVEVDRGRGYGELADSVPVKSGDFVRVESVAPAGLHAALFLFTSEGKLQPLNTASPADEDLPLRFPPQLGKQGAPVSGPPGNELVLMVARRSAPPTEDDLRDLLSGTWELLPSGTVLRLAPDEVKVVGQSRAFDAPVGHQDPEGAVRGRLDEVRRQLRRRFDHFEGLMFSHQP